MHAGAAEVCIAAQIEKFLILSTAPVCRTRTRKTHIMWMSLKQELSFFVAFKAD